MSLLYRLCLATDIGDRRQAELLLEESDSIVKTLSGIIASTEAGMR